MFVFRFGTRDVDPDVLRESLARVPGARIRDVQGGISVLAPAGCAWLVQPLLESLGVRPRIEARPGPDMPRDPAPEGVERTIPGLLPFVPDFLTGYQKDLLRFAIPRAGSHVWAGAGSGKTLVAICWALAVQPCRCVFVTRAGARRTILGEIARYTDSARVRTDVFEDTVPRAVREDASFAVVGRESMRPHVPALLSWKPTALVLDEIHGHKAHRRWDAIPKADGTGVEFRRLENTATAAMHLSRAVSRRLSLTASPVKDRVRDLWAQLDLIEPNTWGSFQLWARRYTAAYTNPWGGIDTTGSSNLDELKKRLAFCARRVDSVVTHRQLPPLRRVVRRIPPSEQVASKGFAAELERAGAAGGLSLLETRLAEAASRKRKAVVEIVEESARGGGKVVVFTGRRKDAEDLAKFAKRALPAAPVWMGHGGTPVGVRDAMREAYMTSPGPAVLVGTGDAWGESISLDESDILLVAMLPWTPGQVIQWEGRCHRLSTKRAVLVEYLVAEGTVDEHVADVLLHKLPAVASVVGDARAGAVADDLAGLGDEDAILASILTKLRESPES